MTLNVPRREPVEVEVQVEPGDFISSVDLPVVCGFVIRLGAVALGRLPGYWIDGFDAIGQRGEQFIAAEDTNLIALSDEHLERQTQPRHPI